MEEARELGRKVLRDVSRSFYLSLRFLPPGFREPASLGYLLARISDTIADTEQIEAGVRVEMLAEFCALVRGEGDAEAFAGKLQERFVGLQVHEGERVLMEKSGNVVSWLEGVAQAEQALIRTLIGTITEGQQWDLQRFAGDGVVRLEDDGELERYAYQVAGCVGEFWTDLGFHVRGDYSDRSPSELREMGRRFGMGLQLVNILRDVPEDLEKGRCYLPGTGGVGAAALMEAMPPWREQAEEWMRDGLAYAGSVRGRRMRFASGLPALIGVRTLEKLKQASWEDLVARVKVSRGEVRRCLWRSLVASLKPGAEGWE
jgi:farnesyl-diphosphate farnesyltransferase